MTNRQHTPGPWYIGKDFSDQGRHIYAEQMVCDDDGEEWHPLIASTDDDERLIDWQANAVLIAAAPDLLEALEKYMAAGAGSSTDFQLQREAFFAARAAITKATNTNQ
jgi:hypothetical protein